MPSNGAMAVQSTSRSMVHRLVSHSLAFELELETVW
jgi:hypothetical protein